MSRSNTPLASALNDLVAQSYILFAQTHQHHWNVEGPNFGPLHALFEEHYTELFEAIDEIAERVRALDEYALPFKSPTTLPNMSSAIEDHKDANDAAKHMVSDLIVQNEVVVKAAQTAKEEAVKVEDDETEDMMIARIQLHQKNIWMLKSCIK